jgi:hypothetical protein
VEDERRQSERVVAVKVRQEDDVDVNRLDAEAMHVRQQRRAGVEQHATIDDDGAVVTLRGECRPRAEKCEFQATVTAGLR